MIQKWKVWFCFVCRENPNRGEKYLPKRISLFSFRSGRENSIKNNIKVKCSTKKREGKYEDLEWKPVRVKHLENIGNSDTIQVASKSPTSILRLTTVV